jgi:hypothetical protein
MLYAANDAGGGSIDVFNPSTWAMMLLGFGGLTLVPRAAVAFG